MTNLYLRADGCWKTAAGTPGGSNGQVQVNLAGAFAGLTDIQLTTHIQQFSASLAGDVSASGGGTTNFLRADGAWASPGGSGTVTTTGSPLAGELTKFSSATSITNGDLSGDCSTSGTLAMICLKTNGVLFSQFATDTAAQATAALNLFSSTLQGLVSASGGGTTNFLRADGTWAAPSAGGLCTSIANAFQYNNSGAAGCGTATVLNGTFNINPSAVGTFDAGSFYMAGTRSYVDIFNNVIIGAGAGTTLVNNGNGYSVIIGTGAVGNGSANSAGTQNNVIIGRLAGANVGNGFEEDLFLGASSGFSVSTGTHDICIGYGTCNSNPSTGSNDILIGTGAALCNPSGNVSNEFDLCDNGGAALLRGNLANSTPYLSTPGAFQIGSTTAAGAAAGELVQTKETASTTAPGAGFAKLEWVAGTNAGTCKLIAFAGTSNTPVTVVDNVGTGC
jgi:hypothetical protein